MQQRLSFDFPANTENLSKIGELSAHAGHSAGFNEPEIGDIQLAIDEVCTNTIVHGLKRDPTCTFQLIIQWKEGEIEILVCESGEPFNPDRVRVPDVKAPLEERPVGGLGIYLVRKVMDEVTYGVDEEGVKTLYMVKRVK